MALRNSQLLLCAFESSWLFSNNNFISHFSIFMKSILIFVLSLGLATAAFAQKSESAGANNGTVSRTTPAAPAATPIKPAKQGGAKPKTEEVSFVVSGNCSMCKKRIEGALYSVPGVKTAVWSTGNKKAKVVFQSGKTDLAALQAAVAKVGHDTETAKAEAATYSTLPGCCKYRK
jgi:copper chaperone CopZ